MESGYDRGWYEIVMSKQVPIKSVKIIVILNSTGYMLTSSGLLYSFEVTCVKYR